MQYLCPVCMKKGMKNRVRPYNFNFEEGMWACEAEECSWPLGYQAGNFFQRDAFTCDWTKDPPNPPKECIFQLKELALYTPPMTPAEGESSKESTDIVGEYSLQFPVEDTIMYHENEIAGSTRDFNNLQCLEVSKLEDTSIEGNWEVAKVKVENVNADVWLKTQLSDFQNTDSATLLSITKYDNQIAQDCAHLCINTTDMAEDPNTIDNACKDSDPSERKSDLSNECLQGSNQNESRKVQLNCVANNSDNNIEMLSSTTNLVGDADLMNIDIMLEDVIKNDSYSESIIDEEWINSLFF